LRKAMRSVPEEIALHQHSSHGLRMRARHSSRDQQASNPVDCGFNRQTQVVLSGAIHSRSPLGLHWNQPEYHRGLN
jgi:hypothetical protein